MPYFPCVVLHSKISHQFDISFLERKIIVAKEHTVSYTEHQKCIFKCLIIKELSVNNLYQISEKLLIMKCISIGDIINFRKAKTM